MTRSRLILVAAAGSAAMLAGALGAQYLGGLVPCELCLLQRWPHAIAIALGVLAILLGGWLLPTLGTLTMLVSAGFGLYHTGVERGWWEGPIACTSALQIKGVSPADLLAQINTAPIVRCNEVQASFLHLSMASWNGLLSLVLMLIWLAAARKENR